MRAIRRNPEEQYRLILECRRSGLTDADWCREHGIRVKTFYTWISRIRQKANCPIPPSEHLSSRHNSLPAQDIVKLEVLPHAETNSGPVFASRQGSSAGPQACPDTAPTIEISAGGAIFRFSGNIDPLLYEKTLLMIGGRL